MSYQYFCNRDCEFFPCHLGGDRDDFNCLFCYCPLYTHSDCGGNFTLSESGIKDCSSCLLPHRRKNYRYIIEKLGGK